MINEEKAYSFCSEDIIKIENYEKALADSKIWVCHHKLGIELCKTREELIEMGLYYHRPAIELVFLEKGVHQKMHRKGKKHSVETRDKISKKIKCENHPMYGKHLSQELRDKVSITVKKAMQKPEVIAKLSKPRKKYIWKTSNGEQVIMSGHAKRYHPDWTLIGTEII